MRAAAVAAGIICAGAGLYLLSWQSAAGDENFFEVIAHGLGIYMVGKGIFVAAVLWHYGRQTKPTDRAGTRPLPGAKG